MSVGRDSADLHARVHQITVRSEVLHVGEDDCVVLLGSGAV